MIMYRSIRRRSFGYIEAVISTVVLGSAIVAALGMFGGYVRGIEASVDGLKARELACELLAEIVSRPFEDPNRLPGNFGRAAGETLRKDFNDVDDYHRWEESPPTAFDGTPLGGNEYAGFTRRVVVRNVDAETMQSVVANGSSSAKRITVIVEHNGKLRAKLFAYRTRNDAWN
ncbi:MAG: hypothetical protein V3W34_07360 [Phycisphaerae bacterium]